MPVPSFYHFSEEFDQWGVAREILKLSIDHEGSVKYYLSWYEWILQFSSNMVIKYGLSDEQNGEPVIGHANQIFSSVYFIHRHRGRHHMVVTHSVFALQQSFPRCHVQG